MLTIFEYMKTILKYMKTILQYMKTILKYMKTILQYMKTIIIAVKIQQTFGSLKILSLYLDSQRSRFKKEQIITSLKKLICFFFLKTKTSFFHNNGDNLTFKIFLKCLKCKWTNLCFLRLIS